MRICGVQKLAMVDYPGKLAATVFTGGCNLRCPFCHNALLVTRLEESPALDEGVVLDFLRKRRGLLEGVVLSGGEPLLQKGAADFLEAVRELGYAVKLDTNGFYPDALAEILERKIVDYVAMDIKNSREKYALTCGLDTVDLTPVEESPSKIMVSSRSNTPRSREKRSLSRRRASCLPWRISPLGLRRVRAAVSGRSKTIS